MDHLDNFVCDDVLAHQPLARRGWQVREIPWRSKIDWNQFDLVVIRSTWDYQNDAAAFLGVLEAIDRSQALLQNSLEVVRWNLRKTYLRDLGERGADIVPTCWIPGLDEQGIERLQQLFHEFGVPELIVKPEIGANADHAYRLTPPTLRRLIPDLQKIYANRSLLAQPFLHTVLEEGEFSLFYFLGELSHAILKTPKSGDFRVQEEHGGLIQATPPVPALAEAGRRALDALPFEPPLYARVDLIRDLDDVFRVMELELIEPALYFRMDSGAADRFAEAVGSMFTSS